MKAKSQHFSGNILDAFDFPRFNIMVKKKKLQYQVPWGAIRDAYPILSHPDVNSKVGNIFASVKFESEKYQEKLSELQEEAAQGKCKRLSTFEMDPAKTPKNNSKTDSKEPATPLKKIESELKETNPEMQP